MTIYVAEVKVDGIVEAKVYHETRAVAWAEGIHYLGQYVNEGDEIEFSLKRETSTKDSENDSKKTK